MPGYPAPGEANYRAQQSLLKPPQGGQQSRSLMQGGSFFSNPELVKQLSSLLGGLGQGAGKNYMDYLMNPASSSLFTSQLQGLLQNPQLLQSENMARQNLADQFRIGGGLNSGALGTAGANLESSILGNRQSLAANLLGQTFGQTLGGLQFPVGQLTPLIQALTLNRQQSMQESNPVQPGGFNWAAPGVPSQPRAQPGGFGGGSLWKSLMGSGGGGGGQFHWRT